MPWQVDLGWFTFYYQVLNSIVVLAICNRRSALLVYRSLGWIIILIILIMRVAAQTQTQTPHFFCRLFTSTHRNPNTETDTETENKVEPPHRRRRRRGESLLLNNWPERKCTVERTRTDHRRWALLNALNYGSMYKVFTICRRIWRFAVHCSRRARKVTFTPLIALPEFYSYCCTSNYYYLPVYCSTPAQRRATVFFLTVYLLSLLFLRPMPMGTQSLKFFWNILLLWNR